MDRGRNIRDRAGFARLASGVFGNVTVNVITDLLPPWIPYTHIIMQCQ